MAGVFQPDVFQNDVFQVEAGAVPLAGSSSGTSSVAGVLSGSVPLSGSAAASSDAIADLTVESAGAVDLAGTAAGSSSASAVLSKSVFLSGSSAGSSTAAGVADVLLGLRGSSAGSSTASAHMILDLALSGSADGSTQTAVRLLVTNIEPSPALAILSGLTTPPVIRYDGVDITGHVEIEGCEFRAAVNGAVGSATLPLRDTARTLSFATGGEITIEIEGRRLWGGYVVRVPRRYYYEGSRPLAITPRRLVLECMDYNILFSRRFLFDAADPTQMELKQFPPDTPDDEVLKYYLAHYVDLSGDGVDTATLIEHVGTPSSDVEISGSAGWSLGQLFAFIGRNIGSIWYINPDKQIVYTDVDTPTAPFGLSDRPEGTERGVRELEISEDGSAMKNDALVWGAGQGSSSIVFRRVEDEPSIAAHKRWQYGDFRPTIWRQATVDRIADSVVYGSPQNKRGGKDDAVAVRCVLFAHGLRVGDKTPIHSAVFDYQDVLPIRDMRMTFTSGVPKYQLTLSHEVDAPWSTFEFWFPDWNLPPLPDFDIPDIRFPSFDPCASFASTCLEDDFERSISSGWGTATSGQAWTTNNGQVPLAVSGGVGIIDVEQGDDATTSPGGAAVGIPGCALSYPMEIFFDWRATTPIYPSGFEMYYNEFYNRALSISDANGGTLNFRGTVDEGFFSFAQGNWFRTHILVDENGQRASVWPRDSEEPSNWQIETSQTLSGDDPKFALLVTHSPGDPAVHVEVDNLLVLMGSTTVGEAMGLLGDCEWVVTQNGVRNLGDVGGGAGVDGSAGYLLRDLDDSTIGNSTAALTIARLLTADTWSILGRFRFTGNMSPGSNPDYFLDALAAGFSMAGVVVLTFQRDFVTPSASRIDFSTWSDSDTAFGTFQVSVGVWYWVRVEYDIPGNVARYRWWLDGNSEPGTWNVEIAAGDYRGPGEDHADVFLDVLNSSFGGTANLGFYTGVEFDDLAFTVEGIEFGDTFTRTVTKTSNDAGPGAFWGSAEEGCDPCSEDPIPDEGQPDPPRGETCETLTSMSPPLGYDPDNTYWRATTTFVPGTTKVTLDGLFLRPGVDYAEGDAYYGGFIAIDQSIDTTGKVVYMCYRADPDQGNLAP